MKAHRRLFNLLIAITFTLASCGLFVSQLTLDDFKLLEKGMTYQQVVEELGNPFDRIDDSPVFTTYIYKLKDGQLVYLGFLNQADFLDCAYSYQQSDEGQVFLSIIPKSQELPPNVERQLTYSDFEEFTAGMDYFPDIYNQIGPPNISGLFEGGEVSLIYFLNDGGRIALHSNGGYGCIFRIGYSPDSFGSNWRTVSEDTQHLCDAK